MKNAARPIEAGYPRWVRTVVVVVIGSVLATTGRFLPKKGILRGVHEVEIGAVVK